MIRLKAKPHLFIKNLISHFVLRLRFAKPVAVHLSVLRLPGGGFAAPLTDAIEGHFVRRFGYFLFRFHLADLDAKYGVSKRDDQVDQVEEDEGQVSLIGHSQSGGHVGAATVPGNQRGGDGSRILDFA